MRCFALTARSATRSAAVQPNARFSPFVCDQGTLLRCAAAPVSLLHCGDTRTPSQARFTFLYKNVNGQWKIAEHHSSAMPEAQPAGVAEMFDRWNAALQVGGGGGCYATLVVQCRAAKIRHSGSACC